MANKSDLINDILTNNLSLENIKVDNFILGMLGQTRHFVQAIIDCFEETLTENDLKVIDHCKRALIIALEKEDYQKIRKKLDNMNIELEKIRKNHENENEILQQRKIKFSRFHKKYPSALTRTIHFSEEQIQKLEKLMMNLKCLHGCYPVSFSTFMQMTQLSTDTIDGWNEKFLGYIINISNKYWKWYSRSTNGEATYPATEFLGRHLPKILELQKPDDIAYITKEPGKEFTEKDYAMLNKYIEVFNFNPWETAILRDILKGKGSLFSSEDMKKLYELALSYKILGGEKDKQDKIDFRSFIGEFYIKHDTTFGKQEN